MRVDYCHGDHMTSVGIAYLLTEANARPCIEREEIERVRKEILWQTLVEEAIGIEFHG